jgi:hypothetical protein
MKGTTFLLALSASLTAEWAEAQSLRFFGHGINDIDRVKIRIDDPARPDDPGPPVDVGATDFTIEFWLKPTAENRGVVECGDGNNNNWINGNIVIDRDRWRHGRKYGVSLGSGRIVFSVIDEQQRPRTFCTTTDLRDGRWHHVALQRRISDGYVTVYIDGRLEASGIGPLGDISYPDDGVPNNLCNGPCVNSDPFIVIGAEKHDVGPEWPSYSGWFDELRYSTIIRYEGEFEPPREPFTPDEHTVALYHFDNVGGAEERVIIDSAFEPPPGRSPGERKFGGAPFWKFWAPPDGPQWSTDSPFGTR